MSKSWFILELDTTSPTISVNIPTKSIPQNVIEVVITSNEELSCSEYIYITDSESHIHEYIFSQVDKYTYIGYIDLQNYPIGVSEFHARFLDIVGNKSNEICQSFYIGYIEDDVDAYISYIENNVYCEFKNITNLKLSINEYNVTNIDVKYSKCNIISQESKLNINVIENINKVYKK